MTPNEWKELQSNALGISLLDIMIVYLTFMFQVVEQLEYSVD